MNVPLELKNCLTLDLWTLTSTDVNSSSSYSTQVVSSTETPRSTHNSVVRKPRRAEGLIGRFAPSSNFLHCLPDLVSGCRFFAAPGNSARKRMPKTSAASESRNNSCFATSVSSCGSASWRCGGTQKTSREPSEPASAATSPRSSANATRKSEYVAPSEQVTSTSPSSRWAITTRCCWSGGSALSAMPKMWAAGLTSFPLSPLERRVCCMCAESSMTSRPRASFLDTCRKGKAFDVLLPC
mmetsp:Transcript_71637/g.153102  ORF Transcript_71637/g.153102 Transcript_71637/m.153102 type:complete len:240 (-) Transcript_71637:66-785(-)